MLKICTAGNRNITEEKTADIKASLEEKLISLIDENGTTFMYNGGARGFDLLAAEIAINLKDRGLPIILFLIFPFKENYAVNWTPHEKERLDNALRFADAKIWMTEKYYDGCLRKRDKYLVKNSDICIACMTCGLSGAGQTTRLARERGLTIVTLAR
ncbi:MAG: DUF1273 domain-containing protein [Clostridiales bacterium]|jgi:uncharacterized phage-like protein YoqJ|nr:DUF1273 domain-containing protein [Clostridiales bacterium]